MSLQIFLLYLATWTLLSLTPGPAVMCSVAQATRHGFWPSLAGICGIQLGNFVFFGCVGLGLGALLATATTVFTILRLVGALYLLYLGVRIIWLTFRPLSKTTSHEKAGAAMTTHRSLFLQGLLVQLSNPKVLLFMSALVPQFIEPGHTVPRQLTILAITTIAVDSVVLSSYAFVAYRGIQSFRKSWLATSLERVVGTALVGFGVRLLFSRK